jgi:PhzF family phenazine biosynthesis protein
MRIPIVHVDAFCQRRFAGNPAAVCLLPHWLDEATLQAIAAENNLPATAFIVRRDDGEHDLRWFLPTREIELCGHGTLAAGHVVLDAEPRRETARFFAKSATLTVARAGDKLALTLPRHEVTPQPPLPALVAALGAQPTALYAAQKKLMAVLASGEEVARLAPDFARLGQLDGAPSVIATGPGEGFGCDFVSRYFAPAAGHDEDSVTGSAHCLLVPYWAEQLKADSLVAKQISKRGGQIWCRLGANTVTLSAYVTPFLVGTIEI